MYIRIWRVLCLAELGQFTEADAWGEKAVSEAETTCGPPEKIWATSASGGSMWSGGRSRRRSRPWNLLRIFEGGVLAVYFPRIASSLGTAYVHRERVVEGLALLEEAGARGASIQFRYGQPLVLAQLAEACLLAGDRSKARETATGPSPWLEKAALAAARPTSGSSWASWRLSTIHRTSRWWRRICVRP